MTTPSTNAGTERLTRRGPEEVRAMTPEQFALWQEQCREEEDDFAYMMAFVRDLYPSVRAFFKKDRAARLDEPFADSDTPLYAAFGMLLALVDTFREDPAFEARFRYAHAANMKVLAGRKERRGDGKGKGSDNADA